MTDSPDPWSPYRATIEDHLETCADYLGRLRRSLAGEIAPDRHYFANKAHQLYTAAHRMVRIVQDIDGWLGECGVTHEHNDTDGTRFTAECTLPAGHQGAHDDVPVKLFGRHITHDLRDLADAVERISQHFGWTSLALDCGLTGDRWPDLISAARAAQAPWRELLERYIDEVLATTATVDGRPPVGLIRCHLDFNTDNVLMDRNGQSWVIDWENSGGGNPAQELAQTIFEFAADDADAASAVLFGYRAGGGSAEVRDISTFSMSFAVQANLVEFYARRALEGTERDRARAVWRLESMLPKLLTIQRAERILALCAD